MMSDHPDYSRSRAILIGTANYQDSWFTPLPAAANSLIAMRQVLTDPNLCGWPADRITLLENRTDARRQLQTLRRLSRETDDVLLVYFVGHGVILPRGQLCLTLADTEHEDPDITGLEYQRVREALINSPARVKIVILDCCYAGRVIEALSGDDIANYTDTQGVYTLTASDHVAHVPPLEQQLTAATSFTGELTNLIRDGIVDETEHLPLGTLYVHLRRQLERRNLPTPNQRGTDTAAQFPLTRNAAYQPLIVTPEPIIPELPKPQPAATAAPAVALAESTTQVLTPPTTESPLFIDGIPVVVVGSAPRRKTRSMMIVLIAVICLAAASVAWIVLANQSDNNQRGGSTPTTGESSSTPELNAAVGRVFNPSDRKGGTLRLATAQNWDSLDPGNIYSTSSWNFVRNYGRSLTMFRAAPGAAGNEIVPDLAEALGQPTDEARTWTYRIRKGIRFEDGTEVKARDVKYAIARALDKGALVNGPTYLAELMDTQGYPGPYKNANLDAFKTVTTPDDYTIIFHLKRSFSAFDTLATLPETIPVPQAKDTGAKYAEHVVSTGPYLFDSIEPGKSFALKRNPNYDPATDQQSGRKALPDRIEVRLGMTQEDVDHGVLSGDLDLDVEGLGMATVNQTAVLGDQTLRTRADNAMFPRTWFAVLNQDVAPLNDLNCRKAIIFAADHTGYHGAYESDTGGEIATSLLPPIVPGSQKIDLYNIGAKPQGDVDKAKQALVSCGRPNGFDLTVSYRTERPREGIAANVMRLSLGKVGIRVTLKELPQGDYFKYAGNPDYAKANSLGLMISGWGGDWNDGYSFLEYIVDSRTINATGGNSNLGIRDAAIDKLIDDALKETDTSKRNRYWGEIDKKVMENAFVLPGVWAKATHFRPANVTNIFYSPVFGTYDLTTVGTDRK